MLINLIIYWSEDVLNTFVFHFLVAFFLLASGISFFSGSSLTRRDSATLSGGKHLFSHTHTHTHTH